MATGVNGIATNNEIRTGINSTWPVFTDQCVTFGTIGLYSHLGFSVTSTNIYQMSQGVRYSDIRYAPPEIGRYITFYLAAGQTNTMRDVWLTVVGSNNGIGIYMRISGITGSQHYITFNTLPSSLQITNISVDGLVGSHTDSFGTHITSQMWVLESSANNNCYISDVLV